MKERLKQFMDYKKITAADLADKIDVQRSNVSHVLNGRNKPASQFIEKLLLSFPDMDANWLLTGLGKMTRGPDAPLPMPQPGEMAAISSQNSGNPAHVKAQVKTVVPGKEVERIVVFYNDRTFSDYRPE